MPEVFNSNEISFQFRNRGLPDFQWHTSPPFAEMVKAKHLTFDVRSLDSHKFSFPYHFHRNSEELFVVLAGSATLRLPTEFKTFVQGDIVFMEMGPTSAHQLYNHTDHPCVYLDICTFQGIDVCEYPDSGKTGVYPLGQIFKQDTQVNYFLGEENVRSKWPDNIVKSHKPQ